MRVAQETLVLIIRYLYQFLFNVAYSLDYFSSDESVQLINHSHVVVFFY